MTTILTGEYKQGQIKLDEPPKGLREGRVRIVLIDEAQPHQHQPLVFGKYQEGRMSTPEDFRIAKCGGQMSE